MPRKLISSGRSKAKGVRKAPGRSAKPAGTGQKASTRRGRTTRTAARSGAARRSTAPAPKRASRAAAEAQIIALLDAYSDAIRARDARATVAPYARDVVAYDLAPPLRIPADQVRDPNYIQQWFDTWAGPIESEGRELELVVGDEVAYACGLRHMTGTKTDGEAVDLWFRATACFRRRDGEWRIAHIHNSVPFAMDGSDRALLDLKP